MIKMYIDGKELALANPEDARMFQLALDNDHGGTGVMVGQTYIKVDRITFKDDELGSK